ncbi:MAG: NgoPII family restriction endonuclease [Rikenellaceae bacterium]
MGNIIDAICSIVNNHQYILKQYTDTGNRANSMGLSLEEYIKDVFAGTLGELDDEIRDTRISETFSYLGNQNNPPDSILKNGAAIEVKKIQNNDSAIALNSSYPKAKLYANSHMISSACRDCEDWSEKDMIYCVGVVKESSLSSLAMVYGDDYCADKETYERIKSTIKFGVERIKGVEFAETKELGRVNRVDPLGITYLRIRGMWGIENPFKVFSKFYHRDFQSKFNFMAIINQEQLQKMDNKYELYDLNNKNINFQIKEIKIPNPNNPAKYRDAILVSYKI